MIRGVYLLAMGGLLIAACAQAGRVRPAATVADDDGEYPLSGPAGIAGHVQADYDWTLRTLGGEQVELAAYRGRVLFINMWASWCAPCVAEMGSIARLRDSLRDTEVEFLLVSPEDPTPVERFIKRYGHDLPIFLEVDRMPKAFGLRALPTTFVVDRTGSIVLAHRGAAEWDQEAVRTFLRSL